MVLFGDGRAERVIGDADTRRAASTEESKATGTARASFQLCFGDLSDMSIAVSDARMLASIELK